MRSMPFSLQTFFHLGDLVFFSSGGWPQALFGVSVLVILAGENFFFSFRVGGLDGDSF